MMGVCWSCIYCDYEAIEENTMFLAGRIIEHKANCKGWKKRYKQEQSISLVVWKK